jgi:dynein light intermediate chain
VRVRDEVRMTINAYQSLYESSVAYGMRKSLNSEQKKNEMESHKKQLTDTCNQLGE